MQRTALLLISVALVLPVAAAAGDWFQHRGPHRQGTNDEGGLLASWGNGQPREVWRRPLGAGYSAVAVAGGRLYTMAADGDQEVVLCLDPGSGEILWQTPVGASKASEMDDAGPRSTPAIVDGIVYTASSAALLVALSAEDGSMIWEQDLIEVGSAPRFGYSVSPLVDGDQVIVEGGASEESPGVYAFDRKTGALRWTALTGPAGYSSPIVAEIAGRRQYVFFRRVGAEVVSLTPEGDLLWRHPTNGLAIITTPIFLPPNRVFVASADDAFGGMVLEITENDGTFNTKEVWSERLMRNHFNTSVLVDGFLYGFDNGTLRCLDAADGAKRWARRGLGKGSLLAAGDLLFILADDGTLVLAKASPDGFEELGRTRAMEGRAWTAPSLAHGRLYLRDFDELVTYDVGAGTGAAGMQQ